MRRSLWAAVVLALLAASAASADEKKDGSTSDPPGVPLELKLVARKDAYKLDLGDKKPEEYREMIKTAKPGTLPPPPAVDLEVTVTNTSDKDVTFWAKGDQVVLLLVLEGEGAVSVDTKKPVTLDFRLPEPLTLAPGKSHTYPVKSLAYGFRGIAQQAYWTDAGDYIMRAKLQTGVSPAPKGSKDTGNGYGMVTLTSAPVKIKVEK